MNRFVFQPGDLEIDQPGPKATASKRLRTPRSIYPVGTTIIHYPAAGLSPGVDPHTVRKTTDDNGAEHDSGNGQFTSGSGGGSGGGSDAGQQPADTQTAASAATEAWQPRDTPEAITQDLEANFPTDRESLKRVVHLRWEESENPDYDLREPGAMSKPLDGAKVIAKLPGGSHLLLLDDGVSANKLQSRLQREFGEDSVWVDRAGQRTEDLLDQLPGAAENFFGPDGEALQAKPIKGDVYLMSDDGDEQLVSGKQLQKWTEREQRHQERTRREEEQYQREAAAIRQDLDPQQVSQAQNAVAALAKPFREINGTSQRADSEAVLARLQEGGLSKDDAQQLLDNLVFVGELQQSSVGQGVGKPLAWTYSVPRQPDSKGVRPARAKLTDANGLEHDASGRFGSGHGGSPKAPAPKDPTGAPVSGATTGSGTTPTDSAGALTQSPPTGAPSLEAPPADADHRLTSLHGELQAALATQPELHQQAEASKAKVSTFLQTKGAQLALLLLEPDWAGDLMTDFVFSQVLTSQGSSALAGKAVAYGAAYAILGARKLLGKDVAASILKDTVTEEQRLQAARVLLHGLAESLGVPSPCDEEVEALVLARASNATQPVQKRPPVVVTAFTSAVLKRPCRQGERADITGCEPRRGGGGGGRTSSQEDSSQPNLFDAAASYNAAPPEEKKPAKPKRANPTQIDDSLLNKDKVKEVFGRELSSDDLLDLVGVPQEGGGSTAYSYRALRGHVILSYTNDKLQTTISFYKSGDGKLACHYDYIRASDEARGGPAVPRALAQQLENMTSHGVAFIETHAAGNARSGARGGFIGYRVWPKMGFDAKLEHYDKLDFPEQFKGAATLQELYAMPGGRKVWEEHGSDINCTLDLTTEKGKKAVALAKRLAAAGAAVAEKAMNKANGLSEDEQQLYDDLSGKNGALFPAPGFTSAGSGFTSARAKAITITKDNCHQGERSDLTGCTPVSGEGGGSSQGAADEHAPAAAKPESTAPATPEEIAAGHAKINAIKGSALAGRPKADVSAADVFGSEGFPDGMEIPKTKLESTEATVSLADLRATQSTLNRAGINQAVDDLAAPTFTAEPADVYLTDEGLFIKDGHHRLAALWAAGRTEANVRLYDVRGGKAPSAGEGEEVRQPAASGDKPTVDELAQHIASIQADATPQETAELAGYLRDLSKEDITKLRYQFGIMPWKRTEDDAKQFATFLTQRLGDYERLGREAYAAGVPFKVLHSMTNTVMENAREHRDTVAEMLKRTRQQFEHYAGKPLSRNDYAFNGGDYDSLPAWDVIATSMEASFPELFTTEDKEAGAESILFDYVVAGVPKLPERTKVQAEVLDALRNEYEPPGSKPKRKPKPQPSANTEPEPAANTNAYDDEVPF